jgi:hypothetical protein
MAGMIKIELGRWVDHADSITSRGLGMEIEVE